MAAARSLREGACHGIHARMTDCANPLKAFWWRSF
jgi:hypothetical protein